ncbi:MAG: sensor histidine kinase [Prevotella sp.]
MVWTDHIRQVKIALVAVAVIIAAASLIASHILVSDLKVEEQNKMAIWAEAMRSLNTADETTDLNLVLRVLDGNNTIPVIVTDEKGHVQTMRNVEVSYKDEADSVRQVTRLAETWKGEGHVVRIKIDARAYINVCYDESLMIKRLATYPYIQLGIVVLFAVIAVFALLTSKRAEQNKVWVGLSKETAHQLGTPISSLMAWVEILRETYPEDTLIPEMDNDVKRLQLIADRFSKIGSMPELRSEPLSEVIENVVGYMERRTSHKVIMTTTIDNPQATAMINRQLFEWVIENLCKNAVDAMEGEGHITINVLTNMGRNIIDVSDTGKGIRKKDMANVFRPGFTTKKRGWGLGLSLAKRIIEEYHHGRIYVRTSEVGVGTTFRIELA